ncbi:DUF4276 family protein [bacterium]|nr:DUF4276 family protein [bacterium]
MGFAPGARADDPWRHDFLLKVLVERILDAEGRIETLEDRSLPYLSGNPAGRLCGQAAKFVRECVRAGAGAAVVLVDRDRTQRGKRHRALVHQREELRKFLSIPFAVGVAVETIEAWLLADEMALCRVLGLPNPSEPMGRPEDLCGGAGTVTHPKMVLSNYLARAVDRDAIFRDWAISIGRNADLDVIADRCPQGFARFREDVLREFSPPV